MVPEDRAVPVLGADELRRLLGICAGRGFEDRRDLALVSFLLDTGARRAETMGITLEDVDFDLEVAGVHGKDRRERALPSGKDRARDAAPALRPRGHSQIHPPDASHLRVRMAGPGRQRGRPDAAHRRLSPTDWL